MRKASAFIFLAFFSTSVWSQVNLETSQKFIDDLRKEKKIPGLGVGVIQDGRVLMERGFGWRDREKGLPVDEDTQFSIGSLSKAFTSLAMIMANEGWGLSLDRPIKNQYWGFELNGQEATENATVIDLLSHQSGETRHDLMWLGSPARSDELFWRLPFLETSLSFRGQYKYNNLMYMALGHVLENHTNEDWHQFVQTRILAALGMRRSGTSTTDWRSNFAYPYWYKDSKLVRRPIRVTDNMGPAASVNSTVSDMLRWGHYAVTGRGLRGERLVSRDGHEMWFEPQVSTESPSAAHAAFSEASYALGWRVQEYQGHKIIRHGGSIGSYLSNIVLIPHLKAAIVVMQNVDHTAITSTVAYHLADKLLSAPTPAGLYENEWLWQIEDESSEKPNSKQPQEGQPLSWEFVGEYYNEGYGPMEIFQENGSTWVYYNDWKTKIWKNGSGSLGSTGEYFSWGRYEQGNGIVQEIHLPLESSVSPIVFKR